MLELCQKVVFSEDAFNTIITETINKHPVETGGILLGNIQDGIWYVIESIEPGPGSVFQSHYFEYDHVFVNYLAKARAMRYRTPLVLLGLWHRHPGSFDRFSSTDDETNSDFASTTGFGAISGLVNIDPEFRFTLFHFGENLHYQKVPYFVDDTIIPSALFEKKFTCNIRNRNFDLFRQNSDWDIPDVMLDIMIKENNALEKQYIYDISFEKSARGSIKYCCNLKDSITHISPPKTIFWELQIENNNCFVNSGGQGKLAYFEGCFLELLQNLSGLTINQLINKY